MSSFLSNYAISQEKHFGKPSNFGLPGIIDLPNAKRFPDGELIISQQLHKSLARSGISFQALPQLGFHSAILGTALMVEKPMVVSIMIGVLMHIFHYWMKKVFCLQSLLAFEISLEQVGIPLSISLAQSQSEIFRLRRDWVLVG